MEGLEGRLEAAVQAREGGLEAGASRREGRPGHRAPALRAAGLRADAAIIGPTAARSTSARTSW